MATISPQATPIAGGYLVAWMKMDSGDTCTAWPDPTSSDPNLNVNDASVLTDRSAQVFGGTIGTVHIEGSNAVVTALSAFATLHEVDGSTALSLTSGIRQVLEATYYTRPAPTGGASDTNVLMKITAATNRF